VSVSDSICHRAKVRVDSSWTKVSCGFALQLASYVAYRLVIQL